MERTDAHARRRRLKGRRGRAAALLLLCTLSLAAGYVAEKLVEGDGTTSAATRHTGGRTGTATTRSTPPPRARPVDRRTVRIAGVGDTMLGSTPALPPSPATYLAVERAELRGDIVLGNLEGTLTDASAGKCAPNAADCFAFRVPPEFARDLRLSGFTPLLRLRPGRPG